MVDEIYADVVNDWKMTRAAISYSFLTRIRRNERFPLIEDKPQGQPSC